MMKSIEEAIEAAWQKSHFDEDTYDPDYPIKASSNFAAGFKTGMEFALSHQWISIEDGVPPTDGDYLTLIQPEKGWSYIEIAPWRDGEYQGSQIMAVMFGQDKVTHWMQIPSLPSK